MNIALFELAQGTLASKIECEAELSTFSKSSQVSSLLVEACTGEWFIDLLDPLENGKTFNPSTKKKKKLIHFYFSNIISN